MQRYVKGARGERELLNYLYSKGFSVIRSAGSGVNSISPDIIAIRDGRGLAFECKAWDRGSVAIEKEKYDSLVEWQRNSKMDTYIAWRMSNMGWYFIRLEEMRSNEKSWSVTRSDALAKSRRIESLVGIQ
jgi:Holliday junction resolvase